MMNFMSDPQPTGLEDIFPEPRDAEITEATLDLLTGEGEEFASTLLRRCDISYEFLDCWNRGPHRFSSIGVTLSGPPAVCEMLRGLKGLTSTNLSQQNILVPYEPEELSREAKVIREAFSVAIYSVLPDSLLDTVTIREDA
jgi:hypothetical protein